jgi:hypothetical protein
MAADSVLTDVAPDMHSQPPTGVSATVWRRHVENITPNFVARTCLRSTTWTNKNNSLALVRERTTPTKRLPIVGEVSANFIGYGVTRSQRGGYPRP